MGLFLRSEQELYARIEFAQGLRKAISRRSAAILD
jgi:hypothetical protein